MYPHMQKEMFIYIYMRERERERETCKSIHIWYKLFIAAMAQLFVQYSRHVLGHLHWTTPSPHCTMYVEFNEGVNMKKNERERERSKYSN